VCFSGPSLTSWPAKSCSSTIYWMSKAVARLLSRSCMLVDAARCIAEERCSLRGRSDTAFCCPCAPIPVSMRDCEPRVSAERADAFSYKAVWAKNGGIAKGLVAMLLPPSPLMIHSVLVRTPEGASSGRCRAGTTASCRPVSASPRMSVNVSSRS